MTKNYAKFHFLTTKLSNLIQQNLIIVFFFTLTLTLQRVILWNFLQARDSFSDDDTISSIPSFTDQSDSEDDDDYHED